jgi:drug/metabolite transporter (DMT)-like permease
LLADAALFLVAFIWGSTFVIIKRAINDVPPLTFNSFRFLIAAGFIAIIFRDKIKEFKTNTWRSGILIGIFLFLGYTLQTLGLQYTTASKAGFITGLSVVIVPILSGIKNRQFPPFTALVGAGLATLGLALLSLDEKLIFTKGDLLVLGCALAFALHIISVGEFAREEPSEMLTLLQIGVVGLFSFILAGTKGELSLPLRFSAWAAIVFCGLAATALAYWIQTRAQKFTSPARTALIFSTEPVFGALFAFWLAGEALTSKGIWGCLIIFLGMLFAELG